jgi:hypothetical protein
VQPSAGPPHRRRSCRRRLASAASSSEPPDERGVGAPSSRILSTASHEADPNLRPTAQFSKALRVPARICSSSNCVGPPGPTSRRHSSGVPCTQNTCPATYARRPYRVGVLLYSGFTVATGVVQQAQWPRRHYLRHPMQVTALRSANGTAEEDVGLHQPAQLSQSLQRRHAPCRSREPGH